jgi:hypothetical protein
MIFGGFKSLGKNHIYIYIYPYFYIVFSACSNKIQKINLRFVLHIWIIAKIG